LPVVAFQLYALPVYPEFLRLLEEVYPDEARVLPRSAEDIVRSKQIKEVIRDVREIFRKDPSAKKRMLARWIVPAMPSTRAAGSCGR
jgi:hypothetical protein